MIFGEDVEVGVPSDGAKDPFGAPARSYAWEKVPNVLVAPGATSDLDETRPDGVEVAYTLYLPKTFAGDLRGCRVRVRGEEREYAVVGDPKRYPDALTPGDWNMQAEVARADG